MRIRNKDVISADADPLHLKCRGYKAKTNAPNKARFSFLKSAYKKKNIRGVVKLPNKATTLNAISWLTPNILKNIANKKEKPIDLREYPQNLQSPLILYKHKQLFPSLEMCFAMSK